MATVERLECTHAAVQDPQGNLLTQLVRQSLTPCPVIDRGMNSGVGDLGTCRALGPCRGAWGLVRERVQEAGHGGYRWP